MDQKYCNILVRINLCYVYHVTEAKEKVPALVGSIVVVGSLTCYALLHSCASIESRTDERAALSNSVICAWWVLNWDTTFLEKRSKNYLFCERWRWSWFQYSNQMIKWIPRPCSKQSQILWIALGQYQESSVSRCLVHHFHDIGKSWE